MTSIRSRGWQPDDINSRHVAVLYGKYDHGDVPVPTHRRHDPDGGRGLSLRAANLART
jgi:hypothetical protein